MKKIFKYTIPITDFITVRMPKDAVVLCVQVQNSEPQIWATVTPGSPTEERHFRMFGTGHPLTGEGRYIGTFQIDGGSLVFHLFEAAAA